METQQYAGKCKCGKALDMRIVDNKEEEPQFWIIYGFCKKCEIVYFQGLFVQDEEPIQDRDFIVDYDKVIDEVR